MQNQERRKERIDRGIKVRTEGIYAVSSWQEVTYLVLPRLILIVGLLLLPLLIPSLYWKRVVSIAAIYALLALGFDFLAHFVGLVSLGGAFFIGVGGYTAALLNKSLGLPPVLTIPMATIGGAIICTLLLLPALPLRGVYFAIVTLMYPLALMRIIEALNIFGGTDGILGVASFPNRWIEQYLIILIVIFALFGLRRLVNEDIGLVFRGVKDNDQSVRASGLSITLIQGDCCLHRFWTRFSRRSLSRPYLHVVRNITVRSRFLCHSHCCHSDRWRRNVSRSLIGLFLSGSHLRMAKRIWNLKDCLLFRDPDGVHYVSKRRNHGLCPAEIPSVSEVGKGMSGEDILQVKDVCKTFGGVQALLNVSFNVQEGEVFGIIGPNGSGKTTLINCITGFIKMDSGKVLYQGKNISNRTPNKIANLGLTRTFQIMRPYYSLPAYKNLVIPLFSPRARRTGGWRGGGKLGDRGTVAIDILEEIGFERDSFVPYKLASSLPTGYLKRLELARCLALRPDVILCDEVFSGLSMSEIASMVPLIEKLQLDGITLVMIEHRLRELFRVASRVMVLNFGQKLTEGIPEEVMQDERVKEAYLGSEKASDYI